MFALLRAVTVVLGAGLFAGPAAAIDPFFPAHGNNGIDVLYYDLDLDIGPNSGRIGAEAKLLILAEKRLEQFSLDLHGLNVSRVKVNGFGADYRRVADKLIIDPRWDIPRGFPFYVSIDYAGIPDTIQDPTFPNDPATQLGWFKYRNQTYVLSEPVGASTFFPANDEPTDKALYRFTLTVPQSHIAVANGVLRSARTVGSSRRFVWEMRQPMMTWLATVQVNRYNVFQTRASDGTPVSVYSTPTTPAGHVEDYALSAEMLPDFERWVGPYPFETYASVVIDDPTLFYALETQTISSFPNGWADQFVVAHELAHQWFGNSVSIEKWEDLWLAEGPATYFETLWPHRDDPAAFDEAMLDMYDYVATEPVGPAVVESPEQLFAHPYQVYYRGAIVLYALREKVGDRTFFRILRRFLDENRYRNVTTADLINTAVRVSGDGSVRPLLTSFIYDEAVPLLPGRTGARVRRGPVERPAIVGARCVRGGDDGAACVHYHAH